jgi:hypothetical protein
MYSQVDKPQCLLARNLCIESDLTIRQCCSLRNTERRS